MDDKSHNPLVPLSIFISYRREMLPIALLLKSQIEGHLQFVRVAVDTEDVPIGADFPERLEKLIKGSHAMIVLIGKDWMPTGERPPDRQDWVQHELQCGDTEELLSWPGNEPNPGKREFFPVFLNRELGFEPSELPESLGFLKLKNGLRIYYDSWSRDVSKLLKDIAAKFKAELRLEPEYRDPHSPKAARARSVSDEVLSGALAFDDYRGWYPDNFGRADALHLVKTFEFADFVQAAKFMQVVSEHCRIIDHHPDWRNVHKFVKVSLSTWDGEQRMITVYDLGLALFMNKAAVDVISQRRVG
jgi:pterin-4a-carbinolamine dehydratase